MPAIAWGLAATGALGFISIFAVGVATKMEPSIPVALSAIALVYAAGFAVYLGRQQKINSGVDDVIINESARRLELPLTFGRKERVGVNCADIACLSVEMIEHRGNKGGVSYTYAPTLRLRQADLAPQKLADWSDKLKADEFASWLRGRLGANIPATFTAPVPQDADADAEQTNAAFQVPDEEIRRDENSKIKVTDGPNGREFYFPAARNPGMAFGVTCFLLVWSGFTVVVYLLFKSLFFEIVFSLVDVLIFFGCFNAWFKSSRVTVNPGNVTVRNGYLFFSRTRSFAAGEIIRFETSVGMTSGNKVFQNLKLITRASEDAQVARRERFASPDGRQMIQSRLNALGGITVASGIASPSEAKWLAREMSKALSR
jgi:hypothetical protein